jgi:hypothetical protein
MYRASRNHNMTSTRLANRQAPEDARTQVMDNITTTVTKKRRILGEPVLFEVTVIALGITKDFPK